MGADGQFVRGAEKSADGGFVLEAGGGFDAGTGVEARREAVAGDLGEILGIEAAGDGEGPELGERGGFAPVPGEAVAAGQGAAAAFDENSDWGRQGAGGGQQIGRASCRERV